MKRAITAAALAISVLTGSVAMADSKHDQDRRHDQRDQRSGHYSSRDHVSRDRDHNDRRVDRDDRGRSNRSDNRRWGDRRDSRDDRRYDSRRDNHAWNYQRDNRYDHGTVYRYHAGEYRRPWGYSERSWRRGDRLPVAYYGRPYRIYDYERCGLRGPPRGYYWVRVNHDAVLTAIATDLVLDIAYNTFF